MHTFSSPELKGLMGCSCLWLWSQSEIILPPGSLKGYFLIKGLVRWVRFTSHKDMQWAADPLHPNQVFPGASCLSTLPLLSDGLSHLSLHEAPYVNLPLKQRCACRCQWYLSSTSYRCNFWRFKWCSNWCQLPNIVQIIPQLHWLISVYTLLAACCQKQILHLFSYKMWDIYSVDSFSWWVKWPAAR